MFFEDPDTIQALAIVGGVGAVVGLIAGFFASATNLLGTMLMGVIGAIALSSIMRLLNVTPIYGVGDDFSLVWGALGALVLAFVVGKSNS